MSTHGVSVVLPAPQWFIFVLSVVSEMFILTVVVSHCLCLSGARSKESLGRRQGPHTWRETVAPVGPRPTSLRLLGVLHSQCHLGTKVYVSNAMACVHACFCWVLCNIRDCSQLWRQRPESSSPLQLSVGCALV